MTQVASSLQLNSIPTVQNGKSRLADVFLHSLSLFGWLGAVLVAQSLYQPDWALWIVLVSGGVAWLLSTILSKVTSHDSIFTVLLALVTLIALVVRWDSSLVGIQAFFNQVYQIAHDTDIVYFTLDDTVSSSTCVTWFCACLSVLVALFIRQFTTTQTNFLIPALTLFILAEPGLYLGLTLEPVTALPCILYAGGLLAYCLAAHGNTQKNTAAICGIAGAILVTAVYAIVVLLGTELEYTRSDTDKTRKQSVSESLSSFDVSNIPDSLRELGGALGIYENDSISKLGKTDSLEFDDEDSLTLTLDTLPDTDLYLKGFTGTVYEDSTWLALEDDTDAENASLLTEILENYDCAPQNFSFLFGQSILPDATLSTCTIETLDNSTKVYQPYCAYSSDVGYSGDFDVTISDNTTYTWTLSDAGDDIWGVLSVNALQELEYTIPDDSSSTVASFFRALNLGDADTITLSSRFTSAEAATTPETIAGKVIPAMILESVVYRDYVWDAYTALPDEADLEEVYAALPDEITAQANPETEAETYNLLCDLRDWMAETATYTTAPGRTPSTRDFVNFFLLENQQGYCVHFATAGVILARYLGIPARYCEGYLVNDDIYEEATLTEDGYTITLTDRQSHAWCEIYLDGYGWVPFEMTPGYYDAAVSSSTVETIEVTTTTETESADADAEQETLTQVVTAATDMTEQDAQTTEEESHHIVWICLTVVAALLLLVILALLVIVTWKKGQLRKIQDAEHPERAVYTAYALLLRIGKAIDTPIQKNELLSAYETRLYDVLTGQQIEADAVSQVLHLTAAVDMGQYTPSAEEIHTMAAALSQLLQDVKATLPWYKKISL